MEVRDVTPLPEDGHTFKWIYKMAGILVDGTTETIEYEANRRIVDINKGSVSSTITWSMTPESEGTRLTFNVDYDIRLPVLGKLAQSFLVRMNEQDEKTLVANVKTKMEAQQTLLTRRQIPE